MRPVPAPICLRLVPADRAPFDGALAAGAPASAGGRPDRHVGGCALFPSRICLRLEAQGRVPLDGALAAVWAVPVGDRTGAWAAVMAALSGGGGPGFLRVRHDFGMYASFFGHTDLSDCVQCPSEQ
ncbi:hypothetical protein LNKW23_10160 [Paralimibaculum aggregatum]|uniref:Uncharacterized protein n=1 Tax=Paralimibaculum aggregatum TaxID=3036245 RepID=A0ABQ6LLU6_9RHOB|nr:hypothetical protein LNKW23_10160 [Limibaculum sp. NKW23]